MGGMTSVASLVDLIRQPIKKFMGTLAGLLNRLSGGRITPTSVTLTGFVMHLVIAYLIARKQFVIAGLLLIFFGLFDALDGALARLQKNDGPKGMFLDSVTDKIKEAVLYTSAAYALVASGETYIAVWAAAASGAALLVSYTNAWGEVALNALPKGHQRNRSFRTGLMQFDVRITIFIAGLLFNQLPSAIIIIAIGALLTALGRAISVMKKL